MKINKQLLLTAGAITGMCTAVGTAIYFTPKCKEIRDRYIKEHGEVVAANDCPLQAKLKYTPKHIWNLTKKLAPYYAPTAAGLTVGIGCVVAKDVLHKKDIAMLTASAAATTSYFVAQRDKLKHIAEKTLGDISMKSLPENMHTQTIEETGFGDLLVIDLYSGRKFRSSLEAVENAQKTINDWFLDPEGGYIGYNDIFAELGIEQTRWGATYGWVNSEDWFERNAPIPFENKLYSKNDTENDYGEDVLAIDIPEGWEPIWGWDQM